MSNVLGGLSRAITRPQVHYPRALQVDRKGHHYYIRTGLSSIFLVCPPSGGRTSLSGAASCLLHLSHLSHLSHLLRLSQMSSCSRKGGGRGAVMNINY